MGWAAATSPTRPARRCTGAKTSTTGLAGAGWLAGWPPGCRAVHAHALLLASAIYRTSNSASTATPPAHATPPRSGLNTLQMGISYEALQRCAGGGRGEDVGAGRERRGRRRARPATHTPAPCAASRPLHPAAASTHPLAPIRSRCPTTRAPLPRQVGGRRAARGRHVPRCGPAAPAPRHRRADGGAGAGPRGRAGRDALRGAGPHGVQARARPARPALSGPRVGGGGARTGSPGPRAAGERAPAPALAGPPAQRGAGRGPRARQRVLAVRHGWVPGLGACTPAARARCGRRPLCGAVCGGQPAAALWRLAPPAPPGALADPCAPSAQALPPCPPPEGTLHLDVDNGHLEVALKSGGRGQGGAGRGGAAAAPSAPRPALLLRSCWWPACMQRRRGPQRWPGRRRQRRTLFHVARPCVQREARCGRWTCRTSSAASGGWSRSGSTRSGEAQGGGSLHQTSRRVQLRLPMSPV